MKKIAALSAVALLALVTGCGGKSKSVSAGNENLAPVAPPPPVQPTATPAVTPVTYDAVPATETPAAGGKLAPGSKYTVQKGDTLWNIAQRAYGDGKQYKKIVGANPSIKGTTVNVGQTITIP